MSVVSIVECVSDLLDTHPFGGMVSDGTIVTNETVDFFTDVNPYTTDDFSDVLHVSFFGYRGQVNGQGYLSYRLCYYSLTDNCHECFFHFARELATCCCVPITLTEVSRPNYSKPVYVICAIFTVPFTQCASGCDLPEDDGDEMP